MGMRQSREIPPALPVRDSIGCHDYEWWVAGTPGDGTSMRFTTAWRVYRAGRLLREVSDTYDWHTVDVAQLSRESGLSCRSAAGCRLALLPRRTSGIDALPLTVAECVQIGRFRPRRRQSRDDRAAVSRIMERLDLAHLSRRRLRELSGGQRQRTLIAQALVQVAEIYVLDEPTAALDAESRQHVHDLLAERVRAGAAVVYTSHDAADAALADRTVRLTGAVDHSVSDDAVLRRP
ncbi:ATP-binding cassette domain-containing protein [Micromonospora sp. WMMD975]|uniref:ATP-binding cassette domain-containing protein n=1 Tax=Micromonospora sp. WMMD975 TaxID=3016087 RepID=UPI00249BF935|nr:ATP-binding cassette domain-containing protein [Micromonospora sp. WMMD975]WFE30968.1 ATP-binding cassette domain-containing protein [Micromonospora sp. WMMD975]